MLGNEPLVVHAGLLHRDVPPGVLAQVSRGTGLEQPAVHLHEHSEFVPGLIAAEADFETLEVGEIERQLKARRQLDGIRSL